jgi:precorrin-6B methylase 2
MDLILFLFFLSFLFLIGIFLTFYLPLFLGAPFVPTSEIKIKRILELAEPRPREILYDLGSGNGEILIRAARDYHVQAIGIEINPILVWWSQRKVKKAGLEKQIKIYWGNFFKKNFSDANIVIMYLLQPTNNKIEKKLLKELKPGTRIVSESFTFKKIPFIKCHSEDKFIKLYKIE